MTKANFPSVDDALDSMLDIELIEESTEQSKASEVLVEFEGIDPRLRLLSHSSRSLLNKCARKFQLYRLGSTANEVEDITTVYDQITFDFGTVVGIAIQELLQGIELDKVIFHMYLAWNADLAARNDKQCKSLYDAIFAAQRFHAILAQGYLNDYELVYYNGKPAVELSFRVNLPDGFAYRGYIDGVLRNKITGAVIVLEDKTTSYANINAAQYKNSGQALGYSVILDKIFPGLSSYKVLYLVYGTKQRGFEEFPFDKSAAQRAEWLVDLMMDKQKIDMYESYEQYPKNGDFCFDFYKECPYYGLCDMNIESLTKPLTQNTLDELEKKEVYDFDFDFTELIESQMEKNTDA